MLLIYSPHNGPRLRYTLDFIFREVLGLDYALCQDLSQFQTTTQPKLNYSKERAGESFFLAANGLLETSDIQTQEPASVTVNGLWQLFPSPADDLGFDVFAAVFYMIARYEEWGPYEEDRHGRFEAKQSILFRHNTLSIPVVDRWILLLKEALLQRYPGLPFKERSFQCLTTIDVDNAYWTRGKSFWRVGGAFVKDLLKLNWSSAFLRWKVRGGKAPDPFDAYAWQCELAKELNIPLTYFMLSAATTEYDRSLPPDNKQFQQLVRQLAAQAGLGIHPSYYTHHDLPKLRSEIDALRKMSGQAITVSRKHFLRYKISTAPYELLETGITEDHSMGFASHYGFRAGTCTPFYYYDLKNDKATNLRLVPFALMDSVFYDYLKTTPQDTEALMKKIAQEVMAVNGLLVTVWHDRSFDARQYPGWKERYESFQRWIKSRMFPEKS